MRQDHDYVRGLWHAQGGKIRPVIVIWCSSSDLALATRGAVVAEGVGDRAFSAGGDFDFIQQRMQSTVEDNAQVRSPQHNVGHFFLLQCTTVSQLARIQPAQQRKAPVHSSSSMSTPTFWLCSERSKLPPWFR